MLTALILAAVAAAQTPVQTDSPRVSLSASPAVQYIERRDGQALNFDIVVENAGADSLTLTTVELTVRNAKGQFVSRRFLDSNGFSPSIQTITQRAWAPGEKRLFFNPFHTFPSSYDLHTLTYELHFAKPDRSSHVRTLTVRPVAYTPKTALVLPVDSLLLVYDGHDFYAHHRRLDYMHPVAQQFGIRQNFMRYGYDFVRIAPNGDKRRGADSTNADYYGFGAPILAPAAGVVVRAVDVQPDNFDGKDFFDPSKLVEDPMSLYGNHVVIDHGNGEYSVLGHLRRGSIKVRTGQRVAQGETVAGMGSSGSSYFPHLHYELRTGAKTSVEGLPSYFTSFDRVIGGSVLRGGTDAVDTGDVIRSTRRRWRRRERRARR